jgi:formylmethanofuran dehydrogenase subunit D
MPFIQANETTNYSFEGRKLKKRYFRYSITIPNNILAFMSWKKGDEIEFKLESGKVVLKRKEDI